MKYEELRPHQINEIIKACPLAFIPWGAHEWHGVHNPVGLDTIKIYELALRLCGKTGGVVLPPVYCGYQTMKPWAGFKHTLEFSKDLVTRLAYEYLENLYEEGFKAIVILMGHYGQKHVEAIKRGVEQFSEKHRYPGVLAIPEHEPLSEGGFKCGDHGGKEETSFLLFLRPGLVDLERIPEAPYKPHDGAGEDAREATAEYGEKLTSVFLEYMVPKVNLLLRESIERFPHKISNGD